MELIPGTGLHLIAVERNEQVEKHGFTAEHDTFINDNGEMIDAALQLLAVEYNEGWDSYDTPDGWNVDLMAKMIAKPLINRLVIAGALIAAEIDRLNNEKIQHEKS